MFSKACQYGIKAAIFIAVKSQEKSRVNLNDISKEINSPVAFTAKVLQILSKNGIINSVKGATGGFEIKNEQLDKIMISQIVDSIDGNTIYTNCGLGFDNCSETKPCSVHFKFKHIREGLKDMLETTSLLDLSNNINNKLAFIKR
ncbi:MAG: Rrf2 family transcriptional regulator [Lutibacter sp.]|jgi:Rrf2 family protein|uniref:RrF2 family transcriptional regulator n=1 Tax=Lutibacter sp. TaxID=1925666 RepID=UPI00299E6662|nr:Rrf2 family transcriptional regulator [Lutibacter sp.]MDX1829241.1 Rrf2 family transcriptional regulator [Lutibacter sp.]